MRRCVLCSLQVHYNFNKILMLQEPLLVVAAFYILFFTVIIYVRMDFAITKVWFSPVMNGVFFSVVPQFSSFQKQCTSIYPKRRDAGPGLYLQHLLMSATPLHINNRPVLQM